VATSLLTSLPFWLAGGVYDGDGGNDLRNSDITAGWLDTGILTGSAVGVWGGVTSGAALKVSAATGMNVTVGPGAFVVPNTASATAGGYKATLASSGTLSVAASDPSLPRIDLVVAYVSDVGTSSSFGAIEIITGTAAASPSPPSAPANAVILAQVAVPAAATSIVSGDIADERTFTSAAGGIVIAPKSGGLPGGYNGLMCYDPATGSFYHMGASGAEQAHMLPWAPTMDFWTSNIAISTSATSIAAVAVETDGQTDLKITYHVPGMEQPSPVTQHVWWTVLISSVQLDETDVMLYSTDGASISGHGFTGIAYTNSAQGTTPGAAVHTIALNAQAASGGVDAVASAGRHGYLRVEAVNL